MENLTICIPYHGEVEEIGRLIKSIGNDTKLLIVDDASDKPIDNSIRLEDNCGDSAVRNYCIEHCETEWLMFCDSDDELEDGWEYIVEDAISEHPDAEAIIFRYITQRINKEFEYEDNRQFLQKPYCFGNLYKKEMLDRLNIRFLEELKYLEDNIFTDMIQRYFLLGMIKLYYHDECIYRHLFNDNSTTNGNIEEINFEGSVRNTAIARSYYYEDIIKNKRPIYGRMFTESDKMCLFYQYLPSTIVNIDDSVFVRMIKALRKLYDDLSIPEEIMDIHKQQFQFQGINVPEISFDEWISRYEENNNE